MRAPTITYRVESHGGEDVSRVYRMYNKHIDKQSLVKEIPQDYTDKDLSHIIADDESREMSEWRYIQEEFLYRFDLKFGEKRISLYWIMPEGYRDVLIHTFSKENFSAKDLAIKLTEYSRELKLRQYFIYDYSSNPLVINRRNPSGSITSVIRAQSYMEAQEAVERLISGKASAELIVDMFDGKMSLIRSMADKEQLLEDLETKVGILRIFHLRTEASRELIELYEDYKRNGTSFEEVKALRDDIIRYIEEEK